LEAASNAYALGFCRTFRRSSQASGTHSFVFPQRQYVDTQPVMAIDLELRRDSLAEHKDFVA
jgi:hypothetical protein